MRIALTVYSTILLAAGCAPPAPEPPAEAAPPFELPPMDDRGRHDIDWYLQTAASLQAVGKDEACKRLRALAAHKRLDALPFEEQNVEVMRVFVVCRMLFTARPGGEFPRAAIGGAGFLGGTSYKDWPLDPIEVVDGVPFQVAWGYTLAGTPESPSRYVEYCVENCAWSPTAFRPMTQAEKERALARLLASPKWRRPLTSDEVETLTVQVRERQKP